MITSGYVSGRPAWQTDELEDEWIEEDDSQVTNSVHAHSSSDISLTQPLGSVIVRSDELGDASSDPHSEAGGTFLVREDVAAAPLLPKTPGRNKTGFGKDFFSPLALEKMFEPPSPPANNPTSLPPGQSSAPPIPSRLSHVYAPDADDTDFVGGDTEIIGDDAEIIRDDTEEFWAQANETASDGAMNCMFTFEVPRPSPFSAIGTVPEAQSTPGPPHMGSSALNPPATDPRLRLFQFQYDTFTREHLSAMVDSIAVNTPSGGSGSGNIGETASPPGLSLVNEDSISRLRSAKRIKLSPASDYSHSGDGAVVIFRPPTLRKDYVGESKSLMEKIRQARDFSTVSTVATARSPAGSKEPSPQNVSRSNDHRRPSLQTAVDAVSSRAPSSSWTASSSKRGIYSSLGYREQAANLMAQIRKDMKRSKRLFSGDTEVLRGNLGEQSKSVSDATLQHTSSLAPDTIPKRQRQPEGIRSRIQPGTQSSGIALDHLKASPAEPFRGTGASAEADRELTEGLSNMSLDSQRLLEQFPDPPVALTVTAEVSSSSVTERGRGPEPNPALLTAPTRTAPAYLSSSVRSGRNEDLTRFVSSSTASGTTLTTGSAASFVKHPGPKQITRITPQDVPVLPERVGRMVFDKVMMKWVKSTALATVGPNEEDDMVAEGGVDENDSEDPFRDIESLPEEGCGGQKAVPDIHIERDLEGADEASTNVEESRFEKVGDGSEVEDEEEAELTSFSFDVPSTELEEVNAGQDAQGDSVLTDSEDEHDEDDIVTTAPSFPVGVTSDDSYDYNDSREHTNQPSSEPALQDSPPHLLAPPLVAGSFSTPNSALRVVFATTPASALRPALKSTSITPVSVMKDPSKVSTPSSQLVHRRSVSFSDGKRDGPIVGIGRNAPTPDGSESEDDSPLAGGTSKSSAGLVHSSRSKRIADMLENLEDADFDGESPSKTSTSGRQSMDELQPLTARKPTSTSVKNNGRSQDISRRFFRGHIHPSLMEESRMRRSSQNPYEPYWEDLTSIDLSRHNIDSVARLKEFLPRLDSLSLNNNHLAWLSGIPATVRSLSVTSNVLTGLTSFSHLLNVENLDISRNEIDSLRQLECLRHLRELRADGNRIVSTDGLHKMDGLVKLSLQGNSIRSLDLRQYRWTRLEMLNVSHNRLASVVGLASLPALIALNLDNNSLDELDLDISMPRLRILRVSGNRLKQLNASPFPNLRTLYADNNSLGAITKAFRLAKLENLSVRNQGGKAGLSLFIREVRDVKRLYLSGNPLKHGFISEPCYNLVYLELAACRLTSLPADFARMIPNVRVLNLNYNFLEDARPLEGLTRLRKLTIIGSRIKGTKQLIRVLRGMLDVEMLDFRMNPCTLGWYLPLLVCDVPGALQPSDGDRAGATAGTWRSAGSSTAQASREDEPHGGASRNGHKARGSREGHHAEGASSSTVAGDAENGAGVSAGKGGGGDGGEGASSAAAPRGESGLGVTTWKDLDAKFRRDLPDEAYVGRLAYRGLVMRACPAIRMLDGVEVSEKEREKAERLLKSVLGMVRERDKGPRAQRGPGEGASARDKEARRGRVTEEDAVS